MQKNAKMQKVAFLQLHLKMLTLLFTLQNLNYAFLQVPLEFVEKY